MMTNVMILDMASMAATAGEAQGAAKGQPVAAGQPAVFGDVLSNVTAALDIAMLFEMPAAVGASKQVEGGSAQSKVQPNAAQFVALENLAAGTASKAEAVAQLMGAIKQATPNGDKGDDAAKTDKAPAVSLSAAMLAALAPLVVVESNVADAALVAETAENAVAAAPTTASDGVAAKTASSVASAAVPDAGQSQPAQGATAGQATATPAANKASVEVLEHMMTQTPEAAPAQAAAGKPADDQTLTVKAASNEAVAVKAVVSEVPAGKVAANEAPAREVRIDKTAANDTLAAVLKEAMPPANGQADSVEQIVAGASADDANVQAATDGTSKKAAGDHAAGSSSEIETSARTVQPNRTANALPAGETAKSVEKGGVANVHAASEVLTPAGKPQTDQASQAAPDDPGAPKVAVRNDADAAATGTPGPVAQAVAATVAKEPEVREAVRPRAAAADGVRAVETAGTARSDAARTPDAPTAQSDATRVDQERIIARISQTIAQAEHGGNSTVRLRLYPPDLGTIRVEVTSVRGTVTARIETSTAQGHAAINSNLASLRAQLEDSGVNLRDVQVQYRGAANLALSDRQAGHGGYDAPKREKRKGFEQAIEAIDKPIAPAEMFAAGTINVFA